MLLYASQTLEAGGALPAFFTITVEAIVFQSVTTLLAFSRHAVESDTPMQKIVCNFLIVFLFSDSNATSGPVSRTRTRRCKGSAPSFQRRSIACIRSSALHLRLCSAAV